MIQRIQTLFLLAAAVIVLGVSALPWWQGENLTFQYGQLFNGTEMVFDLSYLFFGALFTGGLILVNIFMFKNRKLQMKLTQLSGILLAILLGGGYYLIGDMIDGNGLSDQGEFTFYFWLIVLSIILNVLARIYIKKDDDLVRSVDRLR